MTTATQVGFNRITVELQPPAARIVLNNPPLNVIDIPMMDELRAALEQIEARAEISAIVFAGSERAFSVGVDIAAHTPDKVRDMLTAFHSVIRSVVGSRKLTVASVRRHCLGGGAELAMMCDMVYASPDSVWGFPEIKLACYPPVAAVALSAIVGQKLAAELVLTGPNVASENLLNFVGFCCDELRLSPRTVSNKFARVAAFLKAHKIKVHDKGDAPRFVEEGTRSLRQEDLKKFFAACDAEERLWFEFFLMTGEREQEVMHTYW